MTTTPDMDIVTAAVNRILASTDFQTLITEGYIGTDDDSTPWVFQGLDDFGKPFRDVEGSGTGAVVVASTTQAPRNRHNTWSFPELRVLVYMDSTRGSDGGAVTLDARRKLMHVFKRLDRLFHLPGNTESDQAWPGLRVHGSNISQSLAIEDVQGTQSNTVRGYTLYETKVD